MMKQWKAMVACLLLCLGCVWTEAAAQRCGAAIDLFNQVRERLGPETSEVKLAESLLQLKRVTNLCPSLGDAWHYRALCEKKLGKERGARYAAGKASEYGSQALEVGLDPFTLSTAAGQGTVPPSIRNKWALVIGVGEFEDSSIPSLNFTAKDARDFAGLIQDPNYGRFDPGRVRLLTDSEATTRNIKASLNWLARMAQPEDLVVIYVSSHGSPRQYDTAGVSYIVTHDTVASDQDQIYATALAMEDLSEAVRYRIRAQRAVLLLDTCFSGGASREQPAGPGLGVSQQTMNRLGQGVGRVVITSSRADEQSWESAELENSYFTHYLLEGLKLKNGLAEVGEIYDYLSQKVSARVSDEKGASQNPMISRSSQALSVQIGMPGTGDTE